MKFLNKNIQLNKMEFLENYDITELAKKYSNDYKCYEKIIIAIDTHIYHLYRIVDIEILDYIKEIDKYTGNEKYAIEYERINKYEFKTFDTLNELFECDNFSNWDIELYETLEEAINDIKE